VAKWKSFVEVAGYAGLAIAIYYSAHDLVVTAGQLGAVGQLVGLFVVVLLMLSGWRLTAAPDAVRRSARREARQFVQRFAILYVFVGALAAAWLIAASTQSGHLMGGVTWDAFDHFVLEFGPACCLSVTVMWTLCSVVKSATEIRRL